MDKVAVIYWSGTGNTEIMAQEIARGMQDNGNEVEISSVENFSGDIGLYSKIAFGCPSMGDEVLEEYDFEPFFQKVESKLTGKKVALFGSYGWGDGQWMRDWQDRTSSAGANLFDKGLIINGTPDNSGKEQCYEFGKSFANY